MRPFIRIGICSVAVVLAGCSGDSYGLHWGQQTKILRVVNGFTSPVDVLVDGGLLITRLAPGSVSWADLPLGSHALQLRRSDSTSAVATVNTTAGVPGTVAAVLASSGVLSTASLDDTNSVVPTGATKVRVLHLAPKAGEIKVYRTQPDYQTPLQWQFPFTYQSNPTSLSAPFFQSTVGTWEIRGWRAADSLTWESARVKTSFSLGSGQKRTVVVLDDGAGGIKLESF